MTTPTTGELMAEALAAVHSTPRGRPSASGFADEVVDALGWSEWPDPWRSDVEQARHNHRDLADLDDGALWAEVERAKWLVAWLPPGHRCHPWFVERWRELRRERARRKGAAHARR